MRSWNSRALRGARVALACVALNGCADRQPPTWPSAGELRAEREGNAVSLSWTSARDEEGVTGYELSTNGAFPLSLAAEASSHRLAGVAAGQSLRFALVALDDAGNRSEALVAEVTMPEAPGAEAARAPHGEVEPGREGEGEGEAEDATDAEPPRDRTDERAAQAAGPRVVPHPAGIPQLPALPRREALGGPLTLRPSMPGAQIQLPEHLQRPQIVRPSEAPPER